MIALLSPAKTLDFDSRIPATAAHSPRFAEEAASLAKSASNLTQKRLAELMDISPQLAKLNAHRFRDFQTADQRPSIYAFAGDVYTGFDASTLDEAAIDFADDHVRILSGLYGLLRPLDAIRPYRLEMGTRWAPYRHKLTDWWDDKIAAALHEDLEHEGSNVVLNLASQEYFASVDGRLSEATRIVDVDFRDGDRFVSFYAKKARGMMARWLVEHRITDINAMKGFDSEGYAFDADSSEPNRWRFVR